MKISIIGAAALTLAIAPTVQADTLSHALDTIGVYAEAVDTPSNVTASDVYGSETANGGNTTGGLGLQLSGVNRDWWFTHIGVNYAFGSPFNGGGVNGVVNGNGSAHVSGHSMSFNLRFGKGFQIGQNALIGPYLAYQYAQFQSSLDGYSATYGNNGVGGGVFAADAVSNSLTVTGHIGYLAGVTATASAAGYAASNPPSSGVLQLGAKIDYQFSREFSVFAGLNYDRYSASYSYTPIALNASATINDIRGIAGLAYHY